MIKKKYDDYSIGVFYAILCYLAWGMFPLFWKQLSHVDAVQVLSHRILWSFVFVGLIVFLTKRRKQLAILKKKRTWLLLSITSVLIATNWVVYIYAVNTGHIVESSFGYYINPLMNVVLGVFVLKERLPKLQIIALIFAFIGIVIIRLYLGRLPIISLVLATSFALYGLFRKIANIEPMTALLVETILLTPFAFGWILFNNTNGTGAFGADTTTSFLLITGGIITAIPLLWFGIAAQKIPLSAIGFIQYLSPTAQLLLGIFIYKEQFSAYHLIGFGFVWLGLIFFSINIYSNISKGNKAKLASIKI